MKRVPETLKSALKSAGTDLCTSEEMSGGGGNEQQSNLSRTMNTLAHSLGTINNHLWNHRRKSQRIKFLKFLLGLLPASQSDRHRRVIKQLGKILTFLGKERCKSCL